MARAPYRTILSRTEVLFHCMEDEEIDFSGWDRADIVHAAHVLRDKVLQLLKDRESATHPCQSALLTFAQGSRKEATDGTHASE